MLELKDNINSKQEAEKFVGRCEKNFYAELYSTLHGVMNGDGVKLITLSGPTCSGKTTTAKILDEIITSRGKNTVVMSIDDFFLDRSSRNDVVSEAPDYDTIRAIDLDYFRYFMSRLLRDESVLVPEYNFTKTKRVGYNEYIPSPDDIYVFEGIQAVYPEITSLLGDEYKSIFISVEDGVSYKGVTLTKDELRLLRRIVRDYKFRGAMVEFTFHLWEGVRDNEEKNIFPNAKNCGFRIDSLLAYEPFIIEKYAAPLLREVPASSRYKKEARDLYDKISVFKNEYFSEEMIPQNSVFREFIG